MTIEEFMESTRADGPPDGLTPPLLALWQDARGDWAEAHRTAQEIDDRDGAWVHAYLHRKEGDVGNAAYWYRRAHRAPPLGPIDVEWEQIASVLLGER